MHFAGLKSVSESNREPLNYYNINVGGTLRLLDVMQKNSVQNIILAHLQLFTGMHQNVQ